VSVESNVKIVEVLLATYNGEKYLAEQLDSLIAQIGVSVSLVVSDDGSDDNTLQILSSYKSKFASIEILKGPKMGPQANFFYLLSQSKGEFIALCDQDDIWEPGHLQASVTRLNPKKPSMTFSSVREFDSTNPAKNRSWPKKIRIQHIENILFENPARGCTMVMNKQFLQIVKSMVPKNSIMHDWWIALVGLSYGCISFSLTPEINYRLHQNNTVGTTPGLATRVKRLIKIIKSASLSTILQMQELHEIHGKMMIRQSKNSISNWITPVKISSLLRQVFCFTRYRQKIIEDVVLRVIFIWVWTRQRVGD
jgi:glycosyltransferase involved in cell wall biosynthesis